MEMETENIKTKNVNQGANVRKLRQIMGMKQDTMAELLNTNQQTVSRIEQKKILDEDTIAQIANILHVSPKIIQELEENANSIVIENNTFQAGSSNVGVVESQRDNIVNHPIDKIMELSKEHASLYERMLAIEKEKVALLEQLLKEK